MLFRASSNFQWRHMNYVHCKHLTRHIRSGHDRALTKCNAPKLDPRKLWKNKFAEISKEMTNQQTHLVSNLKNASKAEKCAHAGESFFPISTAAFPFCFLQAIFWLLLHRLSPHTFAFAVGLCQGIEVAKAMKEKKFVFNFEKQVRHLLHLKHDRSTWEDLGHQDSAAQNEKQFSRKMH